MIETEGEMRVALASLYRLLAFFRTTDLIDTPISARVPGAPGQFLINRYGVLFHEMRPQDLLTIDPGAPPGAAPDVNAAGFTIHSAIHMARPDLVR